MALIPTLKLWKFVTKDAPDPAIGEQLLQAGNTETFRKQEAR